MKKPYPILENILITDVAAEGKALARVGDMVVFVPYVVPGDVVDIQLTKKKKNYAEGRAVAFKKYSEKRCEPFCSHFGVCGGCKWQQLPYSEQIAYKRQQVIDNLTRIGHLELPEVTETLGSENTERYRNKLEYTFSNKAWLTFEQMNLPDEEKPHNALGFHIPGMFDKVLHIENCYLQDSLSDEIRNAVHKYCQDNNLPYFDLRNQNGLMRNLIVRISATTAEVMVIVAFYEKSDKIEPLLQFLADKFPQITSLLYVINGKANDTLFDQDIKVFKGKDHIIETMENLRFKIGPKSFYQTNSLQAYRLYSVVREFANLNNDELVYDLYTGTGTIANFVAGKCKQVIGIEYVPEAIEDAKINASFNNLDNTLFFAGDMKDILTDEFIASHGRPDVIITDPPRAGMHADVIKTILNAAPKRIVYVSCNPATQARDLADLCVNYKIEAVQPVDMFPHTQHVENVVLLTCKYMYAEKPIKQMDLSKLVGAVTLSEEDINNDARLSCLFK
ncbi:MAG: 23S rRNA (uracil(1939)-C(5))-methyltransferase RlmD [Paludibacteraceae bacterium]|nr:23S rRNA (uracil(1939)-C(5))-methyltransferase RlmD [Paludibacteraceae bacterium]